MQIQGSKILILGGWGLVGAAICHKLMEQKPSKLFISSLKKHEAEDAVNQLRSEYPDSDPNMFVPLWGNIFTRTAWKDKDWNDVLSDSDTRKGAISDIFNQLDKEILNGSALYSFISDSKPDLVIDCINTATAIAYQNIYQTAGNVINDLKNDKIEETSVERLLASLYMPQLIRHVQILYQELIDSNTTMYLKIGTSGTGGMGLNIPYTHSEERPSRVLLAKTAVAGAMTLLLFLMARTPNGPLVKEIKPTAAIAWKKIAYDTVMRKGRPIPLCDMPIDKARSVENDFEFDNKSDIINSGDNFKSVFIDTGENGIFSKGEFLAIASLGQMEIITPEEIATYAVFEILAGNTGHDVIAGLDSTTLGPSYRGGMLFNNAVATLNAIEKETGVDSIAFEMLGPPRLSKLLFEAYILRKTAGSMESVMAEKPEVLSEKAFELIKNNSEIRSQMLSIGLVVLFPDGKNYLRGNDVKIPVRSADILKGDMKNINQWCEEGWVDLRSDNFVSWQDRFKRIIDQSNKVPEEDSSSRYFYNPAYWDGYKSIDEGKLAAWIFEFEDNGWRFKR